MAKSPETESAGKQTADKRPAVTDAPLPPITQWAPQLLVAWLVPGGAHFMLKRHLRGGLLAFAVVAMFLFGVMMRGATFQQPFFEMLEQVPKPDILTRIMTTGGYIANLATGVLYFLTNWFGYNQPDVAGHVHDYGTKFLVGAGLLNILAVVDAFEIATGRRE